MKIMQCSRVTFRVTAFRPLIATVILVAAVLPIQGRTACLPATAGQSGRNASASTSGKTPFIFDGNRMYAELTIVCPNGVSHKTFAFVDLGSPSTIVSPALYKELGLDKKRPLRFRIGEMEVTIDSRAVDTDAWLPFAIGNQRKVEVLLPAGVMQKYEVVLDYAERTLTLAQPGSIKPQRIPVPFQVNSKTGLATVEVTINGKSYPMTIDNGSAYTWLSNATARKWLGLHPDWERGTGAVGLSHMRMAGDGIEARGILVRIPEIRLGTLRIHDIGALAIGPNAKHWDFIGWYSRKNAVPVIGWLGANVLHGFRITLDYQNHLSYWLAQSPLDSHDLDQVGLTLAKKNGSRFSVRASVIEFQNRSPNNVFYFVPHTLNRNTRLPDKHNIDIVVLFSQLWLPGFEDSGAGPFFLRFRSLICSLEETR